jgi:acyl carrier protein
MITLPSNESSRSGPDQIGSWDSLAMVEVDAGVKERFGYAMLPEELIGIRMIGDIKALLQSRGVAFTGQPR